VLDMHRGVVFQAVSALRMCGLPCGRRSSVGRFRRSSGVGKHLPVVQQVFSSRHCCGVLSRAFPRSSVHQRLGWAPSSLLPLHSLSRLLEARVVDCVTSRSHNGSPST
jgi:hypothetical protein